MAVIVGPDIETLRVRARQAVMDHYVAVAMRDQRPATQRAMDTYKVGEAKTIMSGGRSSLLEREAAMRSVSPVDLAKLVLAEGYALEAIELDRVEVSLQIDTATTHSEILAVLASKRIALT